jgi:surfeit locus 1 family protein
VPAAPGPRLFAPRLVPTLLLAPALVLLTWLGNWQLHRADEMRVIQAAFDSSDAAPVPLPPAATAQRYRRVVVTGRYDPAHQFLLDNMTHAGAVGYRVLTPLLSDGGATVLVDRGWIPLGASRAQLPPLSVGADERTVTGRVDALPRAGISPPATASSGWPRVLNYPPLAAFASALDRTVYPQLVLLDATAPDGFVRDWHPTGLSPDRHVGYAVQWYALAATLLVLYVVHSRRARKAT